MNNCVCFLYKYVHQSLVVITQGIQIWDRMTLRDLIPFIYLLISIQSQQIQSNGKSKQQSFLIAKAVRSYLAMSFFNWLFLYGKHRFISENLKIPLASLSWGDRVKPVSHWSCIRFPCCLFTNARVRVNDIAMWTAGVATLTYFYYYLTHVTT